MAFACLLEFPVGDGLVFHNRFFLCNRLNAYTACWIAAVETTNHRTEPPLSPIGYKSES